MDVAYKMLLRIRRKKQYCLSWDYCGIRNIPLMISQPVGSDGNLRLHAPKAIAEAAWQNGVNGLTGRVSVLILRCKDIWN